jgi:hypothetical protein
MQIFMKIQGSVDMQSFLKDIKKKNFFSKKIEKKKQEKA